MERAASSELLGTLKARIVLGAYAEPAGPSEVARLLEMPANTVHYWTRRLVEEGLLEQVEQEGRVRKYRSRISEDPCEPEACAPFIRNVMKALDRVVMAAAERHDLADEPTPSLLPEIGVHEIRLRPGDVGRIVEAFKAAIPTSDEQASGSSDAYTVSFIVAPGRFSDHL